MASDHQYYYCFRKLLLLYLVFFLFVSSLFVSVFAEIQLQRKQSIGRRRRMLAVEMEEEDEEKPIKKKTSLATKNQTKLLKPTTKNSTKNTTISISLPKNLLKKLNSTKSSSNSTSAKKSSLDLSKSTTPKNKTQITSTKQYSDKKPTSDLKSKNPELKSKNPENKIQLTDKKLQQTKSPKPIIPNWMDQDETELDDDFVSEFRDLPSKFQQTLIPDLERMSTTSKAYITKANKEISEGFKPFVGNKYAPTIASLISCIFILAPLLLVSLIINRFKAYFSLQKILIFCQVYLSIYFSILSLASIVTGLEPLKFFYTTSQSSYVCLQVLQTLGYVFYLLLLLMYLVLVFSTETGLGSKVLGLGQTFVGFSVGLHYYVTVFHRAVLHQAPKTNWKVHGIYATCFLLICVFAGAERRKKSYLEEGGNEGKKS